MTCSFQMKDLMDSVFEMIPTEKKKLFSIPVWDML